MRFRHSQDDAWELLASSHTGILTTLRRDGRPITLPTWFVVLDGAIFLRTPKQSKKIARLRNDPRAYFLIERGTDWIELEAVTLEVRGSIVEDPDLIERANAAIDEKYAAHVAPPESLPEPVQAAYAHMIVVRLDPVGRLNSWNNRALVRPKQQETP